MGDDTEEETVPVPARTLVEVLETLEMATVKSRLMDAIYSSMNEAQHWAMAHWHSYVCEKCGHTMITDGRSLSERLQQQQDES